MQAARSGVEFRGIRQEFLKAAGLAAGSFSAGLEAKKSAAAALLGLSGEPSRPKILPIKTQSGPGLEKARST